MTQNFIYQRELYRYLLDRDWNVFGTLKFHSQNRISGNRAHMQVRMFWNKLDRVIYGAAAEIGCRTQRWCFAHAGAHSDNYHVHFVALAPIDMLEFCALANTLWAKTSPATAGIDQNWITPVLYPDRVAGYATREVWKLGPASFDTRISADTGVTYQHTPERDLAQATRIARAITDNERQAAHLALEQHRAGTLLRLALRERKLSGKATSE
jgi:hypothetical protein